MDMICIGDLHLTSQTGKGALSAYIDKPDAMVASLVRQCLRYARKKHIKHVVFLGDICEKTRMSYEAMRELLKILHHPFHFHFILGNHDLYSEDPSLGHSLELIQDLNLENVSIYTVPTKVDIEGASVNFLPWPHSTFDKDSLNIAHVDVKGAKTDSGREVVDGTSSSAYAVVGHIHTRHRVRNTFYPGTLYQTNFGEHPDKFFAHVSNDDGWEVDMIPVAPRCMLTTVMVESAADLESVNPDHLIKLILMPGSKVSASDYNHLNVVKIRAATNEKEVALAKLEELSEGSEIEFSSIEFFQEWLDSRSIPSTVKARALELRREILQGA